MRDLPRGTVTFLFTDVEGSTRLLKQLGEEYGEVLAEHQRIPRAAFEEAGGEEIEYLPAHLNMFGSGQRVEVSCPLQPLNP